MSDGIQIKDLILYNITKKRIYYYSISFAITLGLLISFTSPVEFQSSIKMLPESPNNSLTGSSSILKSFGIANLPVSEENYFDPVHFKEIIATNEFINILVNSEIEFSSGNIVLRTYLVDEYTPALIYRIARSILNTYKKVRLFLLPPNEYLIREDYLDDGFLILSEDDLYVIELMRKRISLNIDEINGTFTIYAEMPDPIASVNTVLAINNYFIEFANKYQIQKEEATLKFLEQRYSELLIRYNDSMEALSDYLDKNVNVKSKKAKLIEENLRNEVNISFEIYRSISQQVEQSRIKVKNRTPVFTVLKKPTAPIEKSSPQRFLIMLLSIFMGVFIPFCTYFVMFLRINYEKIKLY